MAKKDQSDIAAMSMDEIQRETARLELENKRLALEHLQNQVGEARERKTEAERRRKANQAALDAPTKQYQEQGICAHHKGGKNLEGLLNGSANVYSITKYTYSHSQYPEVMCTRCQREWKRPDPANFYIWAERRWTSKKADLKAYLAVLREYNEALSWPTDNEPAGSQIFRVELAPEPVAAE